MIRKIVVCCAAAVLVSCVCYGAPLLENDSFILSLDTYLRTDVVTFRNVVDLDSRNKDDDTVYFGMDYSFGITQEYKNAGPKLYLKLERNGPYDYGAPLFVHNTLMTSGGVIERYRREELLPNIEEFWVDAPLSREFRYKVGLYSYSVGNGFALNGGYENFGVMLTHESGLRRARLYYSRPDIHNKIRFGPPIPQEEDQGIRYEHNAANFFAADVCWGTEKNYLQPYAGALVDYTSADKRDNSFAAPIQRDILGTVGLSWSRQFASWVLKSEAAHNFGMAESADAAYKDVYHTGYLLYTSVQYETERFTPSLQFLAGSGNKVSLDDAASGAAAPAGGKNRAFSYSSPLNRNLSDAVSSSNTDMLPIVAMGGGYGINYGIPRPKTFYSGDFENLIMPSLGVDFHAAKKLEIGLYWYYLRSFCRGAGTFNGEARRLSADLGHEMDVFIDYQAAKNVLVSILGGYFWPGRFFKEERDDAEGSLLTPFVRGDGAADAAYQIELAVEVKF